MLQSREKLLPCPPGPLGMDRRWKSVVELAPNCPRCDSSNTKFCYYNNYSLTQPRYFCKGCRRYWTKGGSLRNVPVGGGCRKNRRAKSVRPPAADHRPAGVGSHSAESDCAGSFSQSSSDLGASSADASPIDLAAVYAKFLSPHPDFHAAAAAGGLGIAIGVDAGGVGGGGGTYSAGSSFEISSNGSNQGCDQSPVEFAGEQTVLECSFDDLADGQFLHHDSPFTAEFDQFPSQSETLQPISDFNPVIYELPAVAPADPFPAHDALWPSGLAEPSFPPPPQGFDAIVDDHLGLHPTFLNPNWSTSFDLTAYDAFTRP